MAGSENNPPEHRRDETLIELPLFPLNVVLFPGVPLPLHIFEERYKAMIGRCLEQNEPFGVVLIKEGPEVGGPAEPHRIGTTARVLRSELLDEGRMNIMTKGERRCEVVGGTRQSPGVSAEVRFVDEPEGDGAAEAMAEITAEYEALVRNLSALTGGYTSQVPVPTSPVEMSYSIASSVDMPNAVRQELLETETASVRLTQLIPLLERGNQALQAEIAKRNPYRGPRLN